MTYAIFAIIIVLLLAIDIWIDADLIKRNKSIEHPTHTFDIAVAFATLLGVCGLYLEVPGRDYLSILVLIPAIRWIIHDLGLNIARGLPWDYPHNRPRAAKTDALLKRIPVNQVIIKLAFLVVSIFISILIK